MSNISIDEIDKKILMLRNRVNKLGYKIYHYKNLIFKYENQQRDSVDEINELLIEKNELKKQNGK